MQKFPNFKKFFDNLEINAILTCRLSYAKFGYNFVYKFRAQFVENIMWDFQIEFLEA